MSRLLAVLTLAAVVIVTAGCNDTSTTATTSQPPTVEKVGKKGNRTLEVPPIEKVK
jgi:lysophospholipase L1-like esterase